MSNHVLKVLMY